MDSLNAKQHKFDWDNISVGCTDLDHSQNFFGRKHFEHEKWDEMEFIQQKMTKTDIIGDKENIPQCTQKDNLILEGKEFQKLTPHVTKDVEHEKESSDKATDNLAHQCSTKKTEIVSTKGTISKIMPPPPNAYLVKDIYHKNRVLAEQRRAEEERKMREFRSRPAPLFHQNILIQKRKPDHAITKPVTPQVLKKSRETEEKRRRKLEEWKQKMLAPKFEARPPTVLTEKPFIPEKKSTVILQHPFNLHMEKRLQERRYYDENRQKAMEKKKKQEEEEREKLEKECIRELRKASMFKARPNPFKK